MLIHNSMCGKVVSRSGGCLTVRMPDGGDRKLKDKYPCIKTGDKVSILFDYVNDEITSIEPYAGVASDPNEEELECIWPDEDPDYDDFEEPLCWVLADVEECSREQEDEGRGVEDDSALNNIPVGNYHNIKEI